MWTRQQALCTLQDSCCCAYEVMMTPEFRCKNELSCECGLQLRKVALGKTSLISRREEPYTPSADQGWSGWALYSRAEYLSKYRRVTWKLKVLKLNFPSFTCSRRSISTNQHFREKDERAEALHKKLSSDSRIGDRPWGFDRDRESSAPCSLESLWKTFEGLKSTAPKQAPGN
jgi:hypothetical protein